MIINIFDNYEAFVTNHDINTLLIKLGYFVWDTK